MTTTTAADRVAVPERPWPVPGWLAALGIWLLARAVTWATTLVVAGRQVENLWTAAHPAYLDFTTIWDGRWYQDVAENGYEVPVPLGDDGNPRQSGWAFFPAYPALVRLLMEVTRQDFRVVAPLTSLALGAVAGVVAYHLFRRRVARGPALAGVAVLAVFPSAAVLQYAYGDVLALLAVLTGLLLLSGRRYLWCLPVVLVLGLSRPVGLPFALVVLAHLLARRRAARRDGDPFPRREQIGVLALAAATVVGALLFPAATAVASGRLDGYTAVQDAWRSGDQVEFFTPWWGIAQLLFGQLRGAVLLGLAVVAVVVVLAVPPVRRLGVEMWSWCAAYTFWLAAVVEPWSSLLRQLLLLAPLGLALSTTLLGRDGGRGRRGWVALVAVLVASAAMQAWWVDVLWRLEPPTDPPP